MGPGGFHSMGSGSIALFQLVSPSIAFRETLQPTAPSTDLAVTDDAGTTWHSVYHTPGPSGEALGPPLFPMVFVNAHDGFSAAGLPPAELTSNPLDPVLFATRDGGAHWSEDSPPHPWAPGCLTGCRYSLALFSGEENGALVSEESGRNGARVYFDVTADGGMSWVLRSRRDSALGGLAGFSYALASLASPMVWWLAGLDGNKIITQLSTDSGARWSTLAAPAPAGTPIALEASGPSRALMTVLGVTAGGAEMTRVFSTTDQGRKWSPLALPT